MTMDEVHRPAVPLAGTKGIAVMACDACRRLKMRCVGAVNPPCERCAKAKRQCVISHRSRSQHLRGASAQHYFNSPKRPAYRYERNSITSNRTHEHDDTRQLLADRGAVALNTPSASPEVNLQTSPHQNFANHTGLTTSESHRRRHPVLPSVYSDSPLTSAGLEAAFINESSTVRQRRSSQDARSPSSTQVTSSSRQKDEPALTALERDICHLLEFFHSKMAMQTPIFLPDDFSDLRDVVRNRRPLAVCIAFVTARFVPGCRSLRNHLIPDVLKILKMGWEPISGSDEDQRTLFQAFATLSTYASPNDAQTTSGIATYGELTPWALKSLIEMFALRTGLHRSWDDVSRLRFENSSDAIANPAFRRYLLWLWMFAMSHYAALLTRTPPTIREDMSIRSAPSLLEHLQDEYLIKRILAEVELCLVWSEAGTRSRDLGEWWCSPQNGGAIELKLEAFRALDSALVNWSERWHLDDVDDTVYPPKNSLQKGAIDFHYRLTRFNVATYVTRFFHLSAMEQMASAQHDQLPANFPMMIELLLGSMQAAMAISTLPLELSPIQLDLARYIPHLAFTMLTFPCYFVIRASEIPGVPRSTIDKYFSDIKRVGQIFCELAADESHCAAIYGKAILEELSKTEATLQGRQTLAATESFQSRSSPPLNKNHNSAQPNIATETVSDDLPCGLNQTEAMNHFAHPLSMHQWQFFDGALNTQDQFAAFGDMETWFLNNFWDPLGNSNLEA